MNATVSRTTPARDTHHDTTFAWLMHRHQANLEQYLRHDTTVPILEGKENYAYDALFIVANGAGIGELLYKDKILKDKPCDTSYVASEEDFNEYITHQMMLNSDGGHVYDSDNRCMFRVPKFNSNKVNLSLSERIAAVFRPGLYEPIDIDYESFLPADFASRDGVKAPSVENLGTRTQSAVEMATRYDHVHVFLIRQSAYGDSGMGKLIHMTHDGVTQEFYFRRDAEQRFVGVHRVYDRIEGKLQKTYEETTVSVMRPVVSRQVRTPSGRDVPVPAYS